MRASCRKRAAVVAPGAADYHLRMQGDASNERRARDAGGGATRVERRDLPGGDAELVVHGPRGTDRIALRPSLYASLHRPFELRAGERVAARCLLALLRVPGGAKLLRAWHARRGA